MTTDSVPSAATTVLRGPITPEQLELLDGVIRSMESCLADLYEQHELTAAELHRRSVA